ncbi:hypothetical protein OG558_23025 [Kribbella sp. NBC_01510]|uniref:hypothetical protein n=1 Tax=Kribbella sp. NBC_01510 TaxID=2903581 RepID=UPI003864E02D
MRVLTTTFGALADPTRLAIVSRLSRGDATMGELAEPHRITLPAMTGSTPAAPAAASLSRPPQLADVTP